MFNLKNLFLQYSHCVSILGKISECFIVRYYNFDENCKKNKWSKEVAAKADYIENYDKYW